MPVDHDANFVPVATTSSGGLPARWAAAGASWCYMHLIAIYNVPVATRVCSWVIEAEDRLLTLDVDVDDG